jgi:hypothetical protein
VRPLSRPSRFSLMRFIARSAPIRCSFVSVVASMDS